VDPLTAPVFLIADDEAATRDVLARMLEKDFPGARIVQVDRAAKVLDAVAAASPDLLFLDWVLGEGETGLELCKRLKARPDTKALPVVLMSGQRIELGDHADTVRGGADFFLKKPFTREEAMAFANALLDRHKPNKAAGVLRAGDLVLRRDDRTAHCGTAPLPTLPPVLFDLLWTLARFSPRPVTREDLVRHVWADGVRDKHVSLAVRRLRAKLAAFPSIQIASISGVGYRLTVL